MNEIRMGRISHEMRRVLSDTILHHLKDPKISAHTSVSEVRVSSDLSLATVYVAVFGTEWEKRQTIEGLSGASGYLKKVLAGEMRLRVMPELRFVLDESIEHGMYMDQLIAETLKKDQENQRARGEENEE
ncbi:30S ribosome-binding factor RbfA [Peptoniphilaceae bacterium SGI.137]